MNAGLVSGVAVEPVRISQVERELSELRECAAYLEKMVAETRQRLSSVILQSPNKEDQPPVPEPILTPLAEELRKILRTVSRSVDNLRRINSEVELP